jgi:hypothetical protein
LLQQAASFAIFVLTYVFAADGRKQLHAVGGIGMVLALDNVLGTRQQSIKRKWFAGRSRIGQQEVIKIVEGFGASQLVEREVSLLSRSSRLHQRACHACHCRRNSQSRQGDGHAVAAHEFARTICGGVRARTDRLVPQVATQIVG